MRAEARVLAEPGSFAATAVGQTRSAMARPVPETLPPVQAQAPREEARSVAIAPKCSPSSICPGRQATGSFFSSLHLRLRFFATVYQQVHRGHQKNRDNYRHQQAAN